MVLRLDVSPELLQWAVDRSRRGVEEIARAVPQFDAWMSGDGRPTVRQLEKFARATYTPVGYLLMERPPAEDLPIPDFRTVRNTAVAEPSPNLLDTIYLCEQRQEWYAGFAARHDLDPVPFVGSARPTDPPASVANTMRETLGFTYQARQQYRTWSDALRSLIDLVEDNGAMVMVSGIVGSNTHRLLDPKEFRGFTLIDDRAPLIFINGADTKAAQIFTMAHELAHVWAGRPGVDKPELGSLDEQAGTEDRRALERWCNRVAAEFLVPTELVPAELSGPTLTDDLDRLARQFKVSTLVVLRRLFDTGAFDWDDYQSAYVDELTRVLELAENNAGSGGNYHNTQPLRVSRRFATALISDTPEGQTLHRLAFQLLGVRKPATFQAFGEELGVA
ncbi:ImmA/IrrE family metallo-endopeptidase [Kribbella solani]|uniref:Zn-dependent peptidase ImmA (M78 family) n=1 Tax=Kribbella solani TaxID=236067 RepID=A0A841E1P1_9ACTN|nr:ImmA/IrrE family metallo-endopeptidase [Kribbella solani]MBB5982327.1 Zn-dependent peptidase ImmA (M78 family) [Kribbella solani]